jgi:uncharacterized protein (DUF1778 family)
MLKHNQTDDIEKKSNLGVLALQKDKLIIQEAANLQRRSVASFVLESSLIRAKQFLKDYKGEQDGN